MYNKKIIMIFVILLLAISSVLPMLTVSGELKQHFGENGLTPSLDYYLKFESDKDYGIEAKGFFTIPTHRGDIKNASLKVRCQADNDSYLLNPKLDIGLDGDYEWIYSGRGYGSAGNQYEFSSGRDRSLVVTARRGTKHFDNRSYILLPKSANVLNASMKIKGGPGQYKHDLMVGITYNGYIYYMKGDQTGGFNGVSSYYDVSSGYTYGIGLGDFDDDNDLDIVYGEWVWGSSAATNFYIIKNSDYNGGSANHPWGNIPSSIKIGNISAGSSWNYPFDLAVEDFDNDGNLDFITNVRSSNYYLFRGKGDGTFKPSEQLKISYSGSYALGKDAADMNNDGNMDFVAGGSVSGSVYYYQGKGDGTFESGKAIGSGPGNYQYSVTTADFNDDYDADIITKGRQWSTSNYYLKFIQGDGNGNFATPVDTSISLSSWWYYGLADNFDFNYDGYQDLVVLDGSTFYYYKGLGNGVFDTSGYIGSGSSSIYSVAAPARMPLGGCENLTLDVGDDDTKEIKLNGNFNSEKTAYLTNYLNSVLGSARNRGLESFVDDYGNEMVKIPLRFDSDTIGSVMIQDLDIKYDYTATVSKLPSGRDNLTTDLNDLLETDLNNTSEARVYFGVYSDTPGRITIKDLNIEYNGAPKLTEEIDDIKVKEDSDSNSINLREHFTDDYDAREDLSFGIYSNSDPEHVALSIADGHWLKINATLVPNWYGTLTGRVYCEDTEGIRSISDEFDIIVQPVNDLPEPNNPLPNFEMLENETKIAFDLDNPKREYFIDVDSDELFYRAVLDTPGEHSDQLAVSVLGAGTLNELELSSIGSYGRNIGVRVYCHDDKELLSMSRSELELLDGFQLFYVNITSRARTFPPQWLPLELPAIPEDTPQENILKLKHYVTDEDDHLDNLTYSIYSLSHSGYIDIVIDDESTELSIYPRDDFDGTAHVTLAVTDDEQNRDLTTLTLEMQPSNDRPIVEISEPGNGSVVRGVVEVIGSAYDPEDELSKVEISVVALGSSGSGIWFPVNGLGYWTYTIDVSSYPTTVKDLVVKVRAEDGTATQSFLDQVYLKISRPRNDLDNDGVSDFKDKFKTNPSEWEDSDGDGYGDNSDAFPDDMTQWLDSDGDGYGDNPEGNRDDQYPFDPTQWTDTDGDGHGDNEWGNEGDYFKFDRDRWKKEEDETKTGDSGGILGIGNLSFIMWVVLIMVIILCLLVLVNYGLKSKKSK